MHFDKTYIPLRDINFSSLLKDNTIYTGGHFLLSGSRIKEMNDGTLASFEYATEMYIEARKKGLSSGLGILINNIGQTCNQSACEVGAVFNKDGFNLPKKYLEILKEHGIDEKDLKIFWEKSIRNRGKKELMKRIKRQHNIVQLEKDYWLSDNGPYGKIILTRGGGSDKYGTPACPLIMGALSLEQEKLGYKNSVNFYYIGNDNLVNIPNHFVIEKGKVVGKKFGAEINVDNIFLMKKRTN